MHVNLGTKDLRSDSREAVTDANGRYSIPLPEGNARPLFFDPPPGYWLPDPGKHWKSFAVTPQQPVYRKDYEVRRGSVWMLRITRGPKQEPVVQGFAHAYHQPGDSSITFNARTDAEGYASVTLPDEAVKVTISLSSKDMDDGRLVKLDKGHGFRTGALKGVKRIDGPGEPRFRITDEAGGTATVEGPVECEPPVRTSSTLVTTSLPEVDPGRSERITGTVIDQDGRPIAGATVTIYYQYRQGGAISGRDEHMRSGTDAQGRFVLRSIPRNRTRAAPCKLSVVVYKDGYAGVDTDVFEFKPGGRRDRSWARSA